MPLLVYRMGGQRFSNKNGRAVDSTARTRRNAAALPGESVRRYSTFLKNGPVYLQSFRKIGAPAMSVSMQGMALRYS